MAIGSLILIFGVVCPITSSTVSRHILPPSSYQKMINGQAFAIKPLNSKAQIPHVLPLHKSALSLGQALFSESKQALYIVLLHYFHQNIENMPTSDQSIAFRRKTRTISTFLKKTYQLLNDESNLSAVRWAPSGIGFIVLNQQTFSKEVLPRYFKHSNYSSFVRQLNMYNFHKIRETNEESYFIHQCFDRFNEHKLAEIKRKPEKKKRKTGESDEEFHSQNEEKERTLKHSKILKVQKQETVHTASVQKVEEGNTRNYFSETCNGEVEKQPELVEEQDKISINNEISERVIPRLATRELIFPSNNNLYPFSGQGQASIFCLFF